MRIRHHLFLALGATLLLPSIAAALPSAIPPEAQSKDQYRIAVCDWMILKRQKLGAFALTREIGADGLELDMGSLGKLDTFDNQLAKPEVRQQFLEKARELNLEICSIAMSGFYAQSFAERPTVPRMIDDTIATMKEMNVKVAFLPLGVMSDPARHPNLRAAVVERLKMAGEKAQAAGVIIGIETELPASEQVKLLDDVGSPAIKIYYNFANAIQNRRDVSEELRVLGRDRICQIHCTNQDGVWLQDDPAVDMKKIKAALDDMGWRGWLVIERSRKASDSRNVKGNFGANSAYLKTVFQSGNN
ncbi:MAG TPA: sugar phosphate isomerase/epimerase family protein [Verrucomicrobiae bacterium]|nr:sugar phosphate isomerase/epimerase family protein [Verrucomicrobiae bacterium]